MKKSRRIAPLRRLAADRERNSARALAECLDRLAKAESRLKDLVRFRADYANAPLSRGDVLDASRLKDLRAFLEKLDDAVSQQQHVVTDCQEGVDRARARWMATSGRLKSLDKVAERFAGEERRADDRSEQRHLDEISGRVTTRD